MFRARDLPLLAVFAAVARRRSFTAAAAELGVAKSVVSDHLRSLEERCGARLLDRSSRRMRLTQIGERVLSIAATVVDAARDVDAVVEEHRTSPAGTLRIATTHDLAHRFVAPITAGILARHPQLGVDIVSDDAPHDLIAGRFDLAVRLGAPRDSTLVLRKLGTFVEPIVAAPSIAAPLMRAARPRDLAGAPWVRHTLVSRGDAWRFHGPRGEVETVRVTTRAQANTGDGVRALLLGGAGAGVLPLYQIAADLRRGALVRLCPEWIWKEVTLHALLAPARTRPKRVEIFLAALRDAIDTTTLEAIG